MSISAQDLTRWSWQALMEGKAAEAEMMLDQALELEGDHVEALYYKAQLLRNTDRFDEALGLFDRCLELVPAEAGKTAEILIDKAQALLECGELAAAERCIDEAHRAKPRLAVIWVLKGRIAARREDYAGAVELFDRALRLEPSDPRTWVYKARALLSSGQADGAIDCAKKATDLQSNSTMAWLVLAEAYEKKGKRLRARRARRKANRSGPQGLIQASRGQRPVPR